MIYFLEQVEDELGPIKIGVTYGNPYLRMLQIQEACGTGMRLLGVVPGNVRHERDLHAWFARHRVGGEWFKRSPELLNFIQHKSQMVASWDVAAITRLNKTIVAGEYSDASRG